VRPDDLPDDDARAMLAKLRQWIETMGVLQSGQTEASAARQAERLIRDLAASVSAALERMEASR